MSLEVACACGTVLEAANADSLLDDAYHHVQIEHQAFPESFSQSFVLNLMRSAQVTAPEMTTSTRVPR
ncbi:MAG: hypothetical protein Q7L55_08460 [Actinomycetota bacterium]|nr:hypothetical protein [Actinomycetota bacterium]